MSRTTEQNKLRNQRARAAIESLKHEMSELRAAELDILKRRSFCMSDDIKAYHQNAADEALEDWKVYDKLLKLFE